MGDTAPRVRVLVAEGNPAERMMLVRLLENSGAVEVIGCTRTARDAVQAVKMLRPQVVLLSDTTQGYQGTATVHGLLAGHPVPMILLTHEDPSPALIAEALVAGALDTLPQPSRHGYCEEDIQVLLSRIVLAAEGMLGLSTLAGRHGTWAEGHRGRARLEQTAPALAPKAMTLVLAGWGGAQALSRLLPSLPPGFPGSLVVLHHIGDGLTEALTQELDRHSHLPVRAMEEGTRLRAGVCYLAGPETPFELLPHHIVRLRGDGLDWDETVRSFVRHAKVPLSAVALTGHDVAAATGLARLLDAGGLVLAQDLQSAVCVRLPREVHQQLNAPLVDVDAIGPHLARWME